MYMTIKEVAAHFRVTDETIHRWSKNSRNGNGDFPIPVTPPGRKTLYLRDEIIGYDSNKEARIAKPRIETPRERAVQRALDKAKLARLGVIMK